MERAALRRVDDGEKRGWIDGQLCEDRPEGCLQPIHSRSAQTPAPTIVDERGERWPDPPGLATGLSGTHDGLVLRRVAQWPPVRCCHGDVPPAPQAAQEKLIGAGPGAQIRHGGAIHVEVLQHVGPQRE